MSMTVLSLLGHRIIRKRSLYGDLRVVSTIPKEKARNFAASLTALLSGNYSESKVDMVEMSNRKLKTEFLLSRPVDLELARKMVKESIEIYNRERPHQSLKYKTPDEVHQALSG